MIAFELINFRCCEVNLIKFSANILAQNLVHGLKHSFQFINEERNDFVAKNQWSSGVLSSKN